MKITNNIAYAGVFDRKTDLFEGQFLIPDGISYNSYVILDERIAVLDSVDAKFTYEWLHGIAAATCGKAPDFLIVQHMEPDHSANIMSFLEAYPEAKIVSSKKALVMTNNFFNTDLTERTITVGDNDSLSLGKHELKFISAPMVHWPEVIVTYDSYENILFSADAFGRFGSTDEMDFWDDEGRRYYIGIVAKYGQAVQKLLSRIPTDIKAICPLHGPMLTKNIHHFISLYDTWSDYRPEEEGITIAYTSIYKNTERAVMRLKEELRLCGARNLSIYDLARCDIHKAVADAFRYSKLVLATTTYNGGVFPHMREFIAKLTERGFGNRTVALIENGSWSPMAIRKMKELLSECDGIKYAENCVTIVSAMNDVAEAKISLLAQELTK